MGKTSRLALMAAVCLGAGALGFGVNQWTARAASSAASNTGSSPTSNASMLFTKNFPDAAGKNQAMDQFKGHVVVVNFWATWCVPCVKEIPALSKLSASYGKKVSFVGIGIDSAANIAEFQQTSKASYPLLIGKDEGSELVRAFGDNAGGLPFTIVIDDKGVIRQTKMGPIDEDELKGWLKSLGA